MKLLLGLALGVAIGTRALAAPEDDLKAAIREVLAADNCAWLLSLPQATTYTPTNEATERRSSYSGRTQRGGASARAKLGG